MGEISKTVRIPLVVDLDIGTGDSTIATDIVEYMSYMNNAVAKILPDGRKVAIPRAGYTRVETNPVAGTRGRGIFYWKETDTYYYVTGDDLYKEGGTDLGNLDSTGGAIDRVYFTQVGTRLLITDPQHSDAYTLQTDDTFAAVNDADFPTTLAHGVVTLNGRAYVLDRDGVIYNSALDDATSWSATGFTEAEREPDGGCYIDKHHDHIVVFGANTIEFFYDNANPTGSPLTRRSDIFYSVGASDGLLYNNGFTRIGDIIYFIGRDTAGSAGVYKLENFQLSKLSKYGLDAHINKNIYTFSNGHYLTAVPSNEKAIILLTLMDITQEFNTTYAYDELTGMWSIFNSLISPNSLGLPFVMWSDGFDFGSGIPLGILMDGDIYKVNINTTEDNDGSNRDITVEIRTGWVDGGTNKYKYCRSLELVANSADDETVTISYSDTNNLDAAYTVSRSLTSYADNNKTKLTRLGRFKRRNWQVSTTIDDQIRLEAIELEVALGDH